MESYVEKSLNCLSKQQSNNGDLFPTGEKRTYFVVK